MKKLTGYVLLLSVLSVVFVFDGCKRGADDPFFSIRSRKARVSGDWAFQSMESNILKHLSNGVYANVDFKIDGDKVTERVDSIQTSHDTIIYTYGIVKENSYSFDRSGKMNYVLIYELTKTWDRFDENTNITYYDKMVYTYEERATGSWNFLSGVEKKGVYKYKNKERLAMMYESDNIQELTNTSHWSVDENGISSPVTWETSTSATENKYSNGEFGQIWVLKELRNNKIVMERDIDNLVQSQFTYVDSYGTSNSGNSKYTELGSETATLKPLK